MITFVPGYRSPLRPVPEEIVPDTTIFFNSVNHNEIQEHNTDYNSTSIVDSCLKDGWWLEAVNFAEQVEKKTLDFGVSAFCPQSALLRYNISFSIEFFLSCITTTAFYS